MRRRISFIFVIHLTLLLPRSTVSFIRSGILSKRFARMDLSQFAFKGSTAGVTKASTSSDVIDLTESPPPKRPLEELLGFVEGQNKKKKRQVAATKGKAEHSAAAAKGLGEMYCTPGTEEKRLRLLIIGHNPSHQAWTKGHYYANPSNRMWPLLTKAGIVPSHFNANSDLLCPSVCGVGFTDVMFGVGETDSSLFSDEALRACTAPFFARLVAHCHRVRNNHHSNSSNSNSSSAEDAAAYSPLILAFAGVRQWRCLFPPSSKWETRFGLQTNRPPNWPPELASSQVFLLPSTSGAAAMTTQQREEPYIQLGMLLKSMH
ncbi:hypothetical protein EON65_28360 [archaeon]|nr:MAG: hypothetical protein EON65_28360 [archaeon]